ncbi:hypothetical protein LARV_00644 [Longilinea arvoryzae]|uniref:Uncharacterized protein n=1 Tax=Longilinea arvoryzae TaxID=360412 RepID=A0A0S7BFN7_9CHLR|nr:hypothetical protein [Longilinea arvoryzae]GAP12904.1 hypothetical protein LARV_00644 [Longilinea arvoryzae]
MQLILTSPLVAARLAWQVQRMEWRAMGGAQRAWMRAGLPAELRPLGAGLCSALLGQLCTIQDAAGAPCWWGYVHAVTLDEGGSKQRLALDRLANRVAALYPLPDGGWARTAWAEDSLSLAQWGRREHLLKCPAEGESGAAAARDALLARSAQPRWTASIGVQPRESEAVLAIEARGWWDCLDWTYFAPGGGRIEHAFSGGAGQPLGDQPANTRIAQSFRLAGESWPAGEAWLKIGKRGSPADALRLELCADSGGTPGAALAAAEIEAAAVPHASGWLRFELPGQLLAADTPYWLALRRTGALDAENHYSLLADEQQGYPGGECRLWNGQAWSARQPPADLNFRVDGLQPFGEWLTALVGGNGRFNSARLDCATSLAALRWRDGRRTCRMELEERLAVGGLIAEVEADRGVSVRQRPLEDEIEGYLQGEAILTRTGQAWPASRPLAGRWVRAGAAAVWAEHVVWEDEMLKMEE